MGWFRESQVEKLIKANEDHAAGRISDNLFTHIVQSSTGQELDTAMRESGGYDEWGCIK